MSAVYAYIVSFRNLAKGVLVFDSNKIKSSVVYIEMHSIDLNHFKLLVLCSHTCSWWLLLKWSAIGLGFNGAKTN